MQDSDQLEQHGIIEFAGLESEADAIARLGAFARVDKKRIQRIGATEDRSRGREFSLSAMYKHGAFPWHTDGAVAWASPRLVALLCIDLDEVAPPTELIDLYSESASVLVQAFRAALIKADLEGWRSSVMRVSEVRDGRRMFRWDPRFRIISGDHNLPQLVDGATASRKVEWALGKLIIFDNWRFLHRRPALLPGSRRTFLRAYSKGE